MIGIRPLDQVDIDIEKEKGVENDEEAKVAAVKYFFSHEMNIPKTTVDTKLSNFEQSKNYPVKQGNDAALEQIIKRSKKAAKITNMDKRGWNTEFRVMSSNIALKKKLDRDLGRKSNSDGNHIRNNLAEIVMVEVMLYESEWLDRPEAPRDTFKNLSGDKELSEDLIKFWMLCGENKNVGVKQLLEKKVVDFKNICATKEDKDDDLKDIDILIEEIPKLIKEMPEGHHLKMFLIEFYETDIRSSKDIAVLSNFHDNLTQLLFDEENAEQSDDEENNDEEDFDTI